MASGNGIDQHSHRPCLQTKGCRYRPNSCTIADVDDERYCDREQDSEQAEMRDKPAEGELLSPDGSDICSVQSADGSDICSVQSADGSDISSVQSADGSDICSVQSTDGSDICSVQSADGSDICSVQSADGSDICSVQSADGSDICSVQSVAKSKLAKSNEDSAWLIDKSEMLTTQSATARLINKSARLTCESASLYQSAVRLGCESVSLTTGSPHLSPESACFSSSESATVFSKSACFSSSESATVFSKSACFSSSESATVFSKSAVFPAELLKLTRQPKESTSVSEKFSNEPSEFADKASHEVEIHYLPKTLSTTNEPSQFNYKANKSEKSSNEKSEFADKASNIAQILNLPVELSTLPSESGNKTNVSEKLRKGPSELDDNAKEPADLDDRGTEPAELDDRGTEPAELDDKGTEPAELDDKGTEPAELDDKGTEPAELDDKGIEPAELDDKGIEPAELDDRAVEPSNLDDDANEPAEFADRPSSAAALISHFPSELLLHVFTFLTPRELCRPVSAVCRRWHEVAYSGCLWTRLDVSHSGMTGEQLYRITQHVPGAVRHLNIAGLRRRFSDTSFAATMKNCPELVDIDMSGVLEASVAMIRSLLVSCPGLQSLNVSGCTRLDHRMMEEIAARAGPRLKRLRLDGCRLTNSSMELMMRHVQGLTQLSLDQVVLSDRTVGTLIAHYCRTLENLALDGRSLTDSAIGGLTACCLRSLSISCCQSLTQQTLCIVGLQEKLDRLVLRKAVTWNAWVLMELFSTSTLTGVRHLDLDQCAQLDDDGLQAISQTCGEYLETLCLSWCVCLSDEGLDHVASNCIRMARLELTGLHRLQGTWLPTAVKTMRDLTFVSFQLCQNVRASVMEDSVRSRPGLTVLNFFGNPVRVNMAY